MADKVGHYFDVSSTVDIVPIETSGAYSHLVKKDNGLSRKMDKKNYLKI